MTEHHVAALYCRLSKEDQDLRQQEESESIQNQKNMLTAYAKAHGWEIYQIYADEDYSGADASRPAFTRMLSDAAAGRFDIVLCKTQSRFSRDMAVIEEYLHDRFLEWGIRFVSVVDNADTAVRGNKKARQINGLINEWFLEDTSDNIRSVFYNKMQQGEYLAAFPPYGYQKDPTQKNHLIVDPGPAAVVRQIFAWHAAGYGAARICQMLNEAGVPTPRKRQEQAGLRKTVRYREGDPGRWIPTTVGDILHNRVYCGDVVQHRTEKVSYKNKHVRRVAEDEWIAVPGMHEAIIPRAQFEATQAAMAGRRHATQTGQVSPLAGKVFCHFCGRPMSRTSSRSAGGAIHYFRCRDKYAYAKGKQCPVGFVREEDIIAAVMEPLLDVLGGRCAVSKHIASLLQSHLPPPETRWRQAQAAALTAQIERLQKAIRDSYVDKASGLITPAQFAAFGADFEQQIAACQRQLAACEAASPEPADAPDTLEAACQFLEGDACLRAVLGGMVDRIVYGRPDGVTGRPMLEIIWGWENPIVGFRANHRCGTGSV